MYHGHSNNPGMNYVPGTSEEEHAYVPGQMNEDYASNKLQSMYDDDKEEGIAYKSGKSEEDSAKSKQEKSEFDTLVEEKGEKPKYDKSSQHGSHESFEPASAQNDFFMNKELMQKMEEAEKKKKEELEEKHKHHSKSSKDEDEHKEKSIEEKINEAIQKAKSS